MKALIGYKENVNSILDSKGGYQDSTTTNDSIIIKIGTSLEIDEFLDEVRQEVSEIDENYNKIIRLEENRKENSEELKIVSDKYHRGCNMKRYKNLIIIDAQIVSL